MGGILIEEDLLVKYSIVDNRLPEGQKIHEILLARAKILAGNYIDFENNPVTFLLSDSDEANAFFAPPFNLRDRPKRDDYKTIRYIKNPISTPVICLTRGLIEMVDNLDQLDFVLGHELTHWMMRMKGILHNSKGEEEIADLHAVDLIYDAGGDPKQALIMAQKIEVYAKAKKEEENKKEYVSRRRDEEEEGVDWSAILDVHMSDSNRKVGIEASLTRLSHLIDERRPTEINKESLSAHYSDPIDVFLSANNFKERKPLGKLKLLVDCIEHISTQIPPEEYFQEKLESVDEDDEDGSYYMREERRKKIQQGISSGYTDYFRGPTIKKHYQQKIANLAEAIFDNVRSEREKKGNQRKPAVINAADLNVYLQDKAYRHIDEHGYPDFGDINYLDASGILYSYFFVLFRENTPRWNKRRDEEFTTKSSPQIDIDINKIKERIRYTKSADGFMAAAKEFKRLNKIRHEIIDVKDDYGGYAKKFDNLTSLGTYGFRRAERDDPVYDDLEVGKKVPWNILLEFAKNDEETKEYILKFLDENGIEDLRITHNLPYIRIRNYECYKVDAEGAVVQKNFPDYEIDFAKNHDVVLAAYDYIRSYFDNEEALIDKTCAEAVDIDDGDFRKYEESLRDTFGRATIASKKVYDLLSMFNALPEDETEDRYSRGMDGILDLIPARFRVENPMPGFNDEGRLTVNKKLFDFDNPVFEQNFGPDYKENLLARKRTRQQKIFEAAFSVLRKAVETWPDVEQKHENLKEKVDKLQREVWDIPRDQEENRKAKERGLMPLQRKINFYSAKKELLEQITFNFLFSIFERDRYWYHLQGMTQDQKDAFAYFAVKDEKGAILQIMDAARYERFCDYLGVLEGQTARVVLGDYTLTEHMQLVVHKYGYCHAATKEDLSAFVVANKGSRYGRDNKDYAWYLHVFDSMKYLKGSPSIDLMALLVGLSRIVEENRSSNGQDSEQIVLERYENYIKLVTNSDLIPLVYKAVAHQGNYEGLSFGGSLETADQMIIVRNQMKKILVKKMSGGWGEKEEISVEPEHQNFLDLLELRIKDLLENAETLALSDSNPLEKMTKLYVLYCAKGQDYSSSPKRDTYLKNRNKEEKGSKKLSSMAENPDFWPKDVLEHIKAFVVAKNVFLDDKDFENKLLRDLLDKVEDLPSGRKKSECLYILLDKNMRAAYPATRDRLFDIYTRDASERLGKDDGSSRYQRRLSVYLKALNDNREKKWDVAKKHGSRETMLSNSISTADKYLLLRRFSDLIISQEQTSQMLRRECQVSLNSDDMLYSYLYGIGVDYLTERMNKDPEMANRFIRFLNSRGEKENCQEISEYIQDTLREDYKNNTVRLSEILRQVDENKCKILYENFWSAPLEARAVIIARMLKCAVGSDEVNQDQNQQSWERVFDVVMDNIIRPDDTSVEAKYARDIMHSYIKSRSDYERVLILSAMMVANRNIGEDIGNVGKALKLFLENMGPAEIKLGQAIASHPDTPEGIRKELQHLKNAADMPARWTVYDWIKTENIPEKFWKDKYLGQIMGAASYYTSIALGDDKVLRILRPEAREKATKGFRVIGLTIEDLRKKEGASDLSYRELTHSVQEMVAQAGRMSEIETDHDLGQQQYETAKGLCDDVFLISGPETFLLKVMDWRARGKNWIIMDRAKGVTFNSLPEETTDQIAYKKNFAKAYILFEMTNILSGGRFDHDRHGAQLSVDMSTNKVGLYDTGAMALHDPLPEEQRLLGEVLYKVLKAGMNGEDIVSTFGSVTSGQIERLHHNAQDTQYLVEVKKGVLALGDFFKILDSDDVRSILPSINIAADLSREVQAGITDQMSFFEKAQWQAFLAMQSAKEGADVIIKRSNRGSKHIVSVDAISIQPSNQNKASWLQTVFVEGHDGKLPLAGSPPVPLNFDVSHHGLRAE